MRTTSISASAQIQHKKVPTHAQMSQRVFPNVSDTLASAKTNRNKGFCQQVIEGVKKLFLWFWVAALVKLFCCCPCANKGEKTKTKEEVIKENLDAMKALLNKFQVKKKEMRDHKFKDWWAEAFADLDEPLQKLLLIEEIREYFQVEDPTVDVSRKWAIENYDQYENDAIHFVVELQRSSDRPEEDPKKTIPKYIENIVRQLRSELTEQQTQESIS